MDGGRSGELQEADADTAEAIDFLEYYGRQILELDKGMKVCSIRRNKRCIYIPLGAGVVLHLNFPRNTTG